MPKDPTKNVDRYKVRGGVINEYEYHENQESLAHDEPKGDGKLIPGTPPEQRPQKATKSTKAKEAVKASKSSKSSAKKASRKTLRGASAKKLAARKAARK